MMTKDTADFEQELAELINKHSRENGSDTPDFILAEYLSDCLKTWNKAIAAREQWYGRTIKSVDDHSSQA